MAGGLAIAFASSDAWPEMGAQAERAVNTGWVFDQRANGVGGFTANVSPSSSGKTFTSTGDSTPFYLSGRALQVVQAAGTVICTVGQSSASGGITTVYLNQFSTQTGLSTTMSTGAITSVAAAPLVVGTTNSDLFSFGQVTPSTGLPPAFAFPGAVGVAGTFTASSTVVAPIAALGTSPASSGILRLPNSAIAIVGKTSTGGNDIVWPAQFSSTTLVADTAVAVAGSFTSLIQKTLAVGTWLLQAGVTVSTTGVAASYATISFSESIHFATASLNSGVFAGAPLGSTLNSAFISLTSIVSHTTAAAYSLNLVSGSTVMKALVVAPHVAGTTGATWFTAVKIG